MDNCLQFSIFYDTGITGVYWDQVEGHPNRPPNYL